MGSSVRLVGCLGSQELQRPSAALLVLCRSYCCHGPSEVEPVKPWQPSKCIGPVVDAGIRELAAATSTFARLSCLNVHATGAERLQLSLESVFEPRATALSQQGLGLDTNKKTYKQLFHGILAGFSGEFVHASQTTILTPTCSKDNAPKVFMFTGLSLSSERQQDWLGIAHLSAGMIRSECSEHCQRTFKLVRSPQKILSS